MSIFAKIRNFFLNTAEEMRKCTWPSRDQLVESTLLVIVTLIILSAYVCGIDLILIEIVKFLTGA